MDRALTKVWTQIERTRSRRRKIVNTGLFRNGPLQNIGGVSVNRAGLQIARTLGTHLAWQMRRARVSDRIRASFAEMERDGIVVLPDFLPTDVFHEIVGEYERSREAHRADYQVLETGTNFVSEELLLSDHWDRFPTSKAHLLENPLINEMASAVMRRDVTYPPLLRLNVRYPLSNNYVDNNSNVLHSDRHYPMMKAFFYLVDVDEQNGAYVYARGSHQLTAARLMHNYEFSIRDAQMRNGEEHHIPPTLVDRGLNVVADEHRQRMGIVETSICGKANTLVMSNNFGFHRRGDFSSDRARVTIDIDFCHLASRARVLFPLLKRLPF